VNNHRPRAKIVYLTAGAGGMFCGSCMHDNALAVAMQQAGWDVQLVATYTPIRTDEPDVSVDHVLFGGINVYLQHKIPLLRFLPSALDRFLDNPKLIRRVTSKAINTDPKMLGTLAVSMLKGTSGNQRKEVFRMVKWLKLSQADALVFSNALIGGCIPELKRQLNLPIIVTLQGDDVFLDSLEPKFRKQCQRLIAENAKHIDAFLVHSAFYRDYIADYFRLPKEKFFITPLGLDVDQFAPALEITNASQRPTFNVGYLARLAPEKGLHHLIDGFIELKSRRGTDSVKLKIAGWQSPQWQSYNEQQWAKLNAAGLSDQFENFGTVDRGEKLDFLKSLDVFSVPAEFLEPKGLYALEAMAAGVPVIAPAHGAFIELIQSTRGGILTPPRSAKAWADAVQQLIADHDLRIQLAQQGQQSVHTKRNSAAMTKSTGKVILEILRRFESAGPA
jgi:glycosyltransferase involved in cell wall biosynthesis